MKNLVIILFIIFLIWMGTGAYLIVTEHEKANVVMGLGVFFMAFILMPVFIYYRYRNGRYQKYILNDKKIKEWMK